MKKCRSALVFSLLNLSLVSCGEDTRNWPTIHFPFEAISVRYIEVHLDSQENLTTNFFKVEDVTEINYFYENISCYPYKEKKEKTLNTSEYWNKLVFQFYFIEQDLSSYRFIYYEYAVMKGKIVFDNGDVHFLSGDFMATYYDYLDQF